MQIHLTKRASVSQSILLAVMAGAFLYGCGQKEAPKPKNEATTVTKPAAKATHIVNDFSLRVSQGATTNPTPMPRDLQLVGGCAGGQPLSLGFYRDRPGMDSFFNLAFDSKEPVTSGRTGAVELGEIRWDDGAFTPPNLPAGSGVMVPNRLTGPGTLTITSHSGKGHAGQMSGNIQGDLKHRGSDETISLSATFDINLACGN